MENADVTLQQDASLHSAGDAWFSRNTLAAHERSHHVTQRWTDQADEWVSLACLRKLHLAQ
jgi:hypothetical protein